MANNNNVTQYSATARINRRWLSFRLSTVFLVVTAVAIGFGYRHIHRYIQFQRLKTFVDCDIRALPEPKRKEFDRITASLLPAKSRLEIIGWYFRENWFVWRLSTDRGMRFVLFQGEHITSIPGVSSAHVFLFDFSGRLVGQSSFSTGWRIDIHDAALSTDKVKNENLIRINTAPVINGVDIRTQYYAIIDDALALVRLEDSSGACIQNDYAAPNHTIGPNAIRRSESEWIRALSDARPAEVLRTLVWLSGHHSRPIENPGNIHIETYEDATLHLKVRMNPKTKFLLESLAANPDSWIADAIQIAAHSLEEAP
jgi:hypothetical protein